MLKPWMGWAAVLGGAVLLGVGVTHASHGTQAMVVIGAVIVAAGWEVARGKITL